VEKQVDQQRLNDYQNRVSDWISRQGVFFQLRYARTIGSRSIVKQLGGLMIRGVFLMLILAVIGFFVLRHYYSSSAYQNKITSQLKEALGAEEVEPSGFSRDSNTGRFRSLEIEGGKRTFFYRAKLEGLNGVFSFFTGVTQDWNPATVRIKKANFELKAGGAQEKMEASFASLLESLKGDGMNLVIIDSLSCDWGYSTLTHGAIRNSAFKAVLKGGSWEVEVAGGTFEQNWLGPVPIEKGILRVNKDGLEVISLKLAFESGRLDLAGDISGPLSMPQFDLEGDFSNLPLEKLINLDGVKTRDYIEGSISGELGISGSSNQRIKISAAVNLAKDDQIVVREKWSLLRALSIIDSDRTYLRLGFPRGSFSFTTEGGGMEIKEIDLVSAESARLVGGVSTRLPSQEEAAKSLGIALTDGFADDFTDKSSAQSLRDSRFSLKERSGDSSQGIGVDIEESVQGGIGRVNDKQLSAKELEGLRLRAEMKIHRINGELRLAVPASAFDDSVKLAELYPKDDEGWRWIPIELKDSTFSSISEEANDKLLAPGKTLSGSGDEVED